MISVVVIGRNVKRLREKLDYSQSFIARRAGVSQSSVGLLESGIGNPTIHVLNAIAEALEVDTFVLIMGWHFEDSTVLRTS